MRPNSIILACVLPLVLGGCAGTGLDEMFRAVGGDPENAMEKVAKIEDGTIAVVGSTVGVYCNAPYVARVALRERLASNPGMKGNRVEVQCLGDPVL